MHDCNLNVYGVRVRCLTSVPAHLDWITDDYGPFFTSDGDGPPDLDVVVGIPGPDEIMTTSVVGNLGSNIEIGPGYIRVTGEALESREVYDADVRGYLTGAIIRRLVAERGFQQFHAAAVVGANGATLIAAAKKHGKSSLGLLLALSGMEYMASDMTFLRCGDDGIEVGGMPQGFTLAAGAVNWFAAHRPDVGLQAHEIAPTLTPRDVYELEVGVKATLDLAVVGRSARIRTELAPLRTIVLPEPNMFRRQPRMTELSSDEAFVRLAMLAEHHLKWGLPVDISAQRYWERVGEVVAGACTQAPVWVMQWCPDHERNLDALLDICT